MPLWSVEFLVINATVSRPTDAPYVPRPTKVVDLRPTPVTAKNLRPRAGSATEED